MQMRACLARLKKHTRHLDTILSFYSEIVIELEFRAIVLLTDYEMNRKGASKTEIRTIDVCGC